MITIRTTRISSVVAAFVQRFPDAIARIDDVVVSGSAEPWCTNARLRGAVDFSLRRNGVDLLGFHDDARDMWASLEALEIVQSLAAQKVLRFSRSNSIPSGWRALAILLIGIGLLALMVFCAIRIGKT